VNNKLTIGVAINTVILSFSCMLLSACETNANQPSNTGKVDKSVLKKATDSPIQEVPISSGSKSKKINKSNMTKSDQLTHCKQDLAQQLNIDKNNISVLMSRPVTWRSGALGCPEDGVSYTQAQVSGRVFVLAADDKTYRYHTALNETPFLCPNSRAESAVVQPGDL